MKQLLLVLIVVFSCTLLCSQTYEITFSAQGDATTVDEVIATNLSTDESVTIPGDGTLTLQATATSIDRVESMENFELFTNLSEGYSEIHLFSTTDQEVSIQIIGLDGRILTSHKQRIPYGSHSFRLTGESKGIYLARVLMKDGARGLKFIQSKIGDNRISYAGNVENHEMLKASHAAYTLSYSPDDHISYAISSGDFVTMIVECPAGDKTIIADMHECIDGDGNHYPVVKIGTQTWMAKNINTSKYMDGTEIPYIATTAEWGALPDHNSGKGYGYFLVEEGDLYGAIYTYGAAVNGIPLSGTPIQGVCPNGWHIPSDAEWKTLSNHLGGTAYASNKLKSTRSDLWKYSPNGISNNSSGFNALPSGYRTAYNGAANLGGYYARWWSSNQYSSSWAYYCELTYANSGVYLSYWEKSVGICVRCLKD